jgi:hypothetical protein
VGKRHLSPSARPRPPSCPLPCVQVPDYDESVVQRAVEALAAKQLGEYEHRRRLEALAAGEALPRCFMTDSRSQLNTLPTSL